MSTHATYQPLVSVVMPVYNAGRYVEKAISSILNQTYSNIELIVINDGSNDHSLEVIKRFQDNRIKLINFPTNLGIVSALNKGVQEAAGTFIARMDADDESHIERIQRQVDYMLNHPDVGVCGTWYKWNSGKIIKPPVTHEVMLYELINRSVFHHASVMMRKEVIAPYQHQLYEKDFEFTEDLALWMKLVRVTRFANLEQVLLTVSANQGTHVKHLNTSSSHNVLLKQQHLEYLFPHLQQADISFLAQQLNRIIPVKADKASFQKFLQVLDQCYQYKPIPEIKLALKAAVWFKLASNAPLSVNWLTYCRDYPFAKTSILQQAWLVLKPLLKHVKN